MFIFNCQNTWTSKNLASAWPHWQKCFEPFCIASGLAAEAEGHQVNTLLYCLGDNAEDVLSSTKKTRRKTFEEDKKYGEVLENFDKIFQVWKNVIIERAWFNSWHQQEGETSEQYITALYHLVETCNYAGLREEIIRDRLVVGIRDKSLSERLQMDAALMWEKAKTAIRQCEAIRLKTTDSCGRETAILIQSQ